jgi:hypothetical protein
LTECDFLEENKVITDIFAGKTALENGCSSSIGHEIIHVTTENDLGLIQQ